MHYVGIDLGKRSMSLAVENDKGAVGKPRSFSCQSAQEIDAFFENLIPFKAVIEASSSYRWLYERLKSLGGEVVLAHPLQLRSIVTARAKTDKLDAAILAKLLRSDLIPRAYVPSAQYQELRDLTRRRAVLSQRLAQAQTEMRHLLWRYNVDSPYAWLLGKKSRQFVQALPLRDLDQDIRQELWLRIDHFAGQIAILDTRLESMASRFPQIEALTAIYGIGLYSALLIVAEVGEPGRFREAGQVACYAGLTTRVKQSGDIARYGHITKQGSPWLRWILIQAAMKVIREDRALGNFYTRIRKRSSRQVARVAVARKLAEICWLRLMRWHHERAA